MADKSSLPAQLKRYWGKGGPGGQKIRWGTPGDFGRCVAAIQKEVSEDGKPLPENVIKGLCANLHRAETGATPGNAPGEKRGKS